MADEGKNNPRGAFSVVSNGSGRPLAAKFAGVRASLKRGSSMRATNRRASSMRPRGKGKR